MFRHCRYSPHSVEKSPNFHYSFRLYLETSQTISIDFIVTKSPELLKKWWILKTTWILLKQNNQNFVDVSVIGSGFKEFCLFLAPEKNEWHNDSQVFFFEFGSIPFFNLFPFFHHLPFKKKSHQAGLVRVGSAGWVGGLGHWKSLWQLWGRWVGWVGGGSVRETSNIWLVGLYTGRKSYPFFLRDCIINYKVVAFLKYFWNFHPDFLKKLTNLTFAYFFKSVGEKPPTTGS